MKKQVKLFYLLLALGSILLMPTTIHAKTKVATPEKVRVRSVKEKKLKVTWKKVKKADGYQIYEYQKKNQKYKKIADVKGRLTSWKNKKTKTEHTYKVRAYKKNRKKKVFSKFSYTVRAIPYKKNAKFVNAGELRIKEDLLDLSTHQCLTPTLKVKPTCYAKNKKAELYDSTIHWSSSDETIAKVTQDGAVTTQGKEGKCRIYARAHNGNMTWITVYVENYATNIQFENVQAMVDDMQDLIHNHQTDIEQIAAFFEKNEAEHPKENQAMTFRLKEERKEVEAEVIKGKAIEYKKIEKRMLKVLQSFPGNMEIIVEWSLIRFNLSGSSNAMSSQYADLIFTFYESKPIEHPSLYFFEIADRWAYEYFLGV